MRDNAQNEGDWSLTQQLFRKHVESIPMNKKHTHVCVRDITELFLLNLHFKL
jgi:hypothetical protein